MLAGDSDVGDWWSYGGTYAEQRFSPLIGISDANVTR